MKGSLEIITEIQQVDIIYKGLYKVIGFNENGYLVCSHLVTTERVLFTTHDIEPWFVQQSITLSCDKGLSYAYKKYVEALSRYYDITNNMDFVLAGYKYE